MRLSTAATWDSLSPSFLPAKDCTSAPADSPALVAPSFIFTKNGLVSVLVIRPTLTGSPPPLLPLEAPPPLLSSPPHAATPTANAIAEPASASPRRVANEVIASPLLSSSQGPDLP